MCGIAGFVVPESDGSLIGPMVQSMAHRGPDGNGAWSTRIGNSRLAFGHRRLAILDLSTAAQQPMIDSITGCVLTYNGEIYNYADLRAELSAGSRPFLSTGDTEVLLRAYLRWGESFITKLRGMFGFCIYDPRKRQLFLGRDHLGIKPVYVTEAWGGRFAFASEVRSLLALPWVGRSLDACGLSGYLAYGSVQEPFTLVSGIRSLPPGHTLAIALSGSGAVVGAPKRFWDLPPVTGAQPAGLMRNAIADSVQRHMVSDLW